MKYLIVLLLLLPTTSFANITCDDTQQPTCSNDNIGQPIVDCLVPFNENLGVCVLRSNTINLPDFILSGQDTNTFGNYVHQGELFAGECGFQQSDYGQIGSYKECLNSHGNTHGVVYNALFDENNYTNTSSYKFIFSNSSQKTLSIILQGLYNLGQSLLIVFGYVILVIVGIYIFKRGLKWLFATSGDSFSEHTRKISDVLIHQAKHLR